MDIEVLACPSRQSQFETFLISNLLSISVKRHRMRDIEQGLGMITIAKKMTAFLFWLTSLFS